MNETEEKGEVVELSTHLEEKYPYGINGFPDVNWEPLPPKKKTDPAKRAQRKRSKQARKKNR